MTKNLQYVRYLFRHKLFVFQAGLRTKASLWRLVIHDWSKLLPCEWFPYLRYFYGDYPEWDAAKIQCSGYCGRTKESVASEFQTAWLHHIHWNKHHWQYWVLLDDPASNTDDNTAALPMPVKYVREMIADWAGAGRAIRGVWDVSGWYKERRDRIILHPITRGFVEQEIERLKL
jgi:hypothetical protein